MVLCPCCEENLNHVDLLRPHLRFFHNNPEHLRCRHCNVIFRSVSSFVRHTRQIHVNIHNEVLNLDIGQEVLNEHNEEAIVDDPGGFNGSEHSDDNDLSDASGDNDHNNNLPNFLDDLCSNVQIFTAQLYSHPNTSRKLVDFVLTAVVDLLGSPVNVLKQSVFSLLSKCECAEDNFADLCAEIEQMFKVLENPMKLMETEQQRFNEFEEMGCYIPPEAVEIGVVDDYEQINQEEVHQNKPVSVQVVPLRKSLKAFLQMPGMFTAITDYMIKLEQDASGKMSNVIQGSRWKEIKSEFPDKLLIPLNLDFDDVEPDNPLGSHRTDHKLGKLYAEIPCLPPEIRSTLDNILFVSTFESKHRKLFGNETVFANVIQELKFLEDEGILIEIDGIEQQVYFCLLQIIGDNLGLNGILGFLEGFRGNFFCRICKLHREETEHICVAAQNRLRTVQNYQADVDSNDSYLTGVKEKCVWNSLTSYHCIKAGICDVMHDIHEGMLKYDISHILFYLVHVRDYLSLQTLKNRIDGFNYGPSEKGNKPPSSRLTIESLQNSSVNFSATEMLCFGRYLGEMIGDLIPKNNPIWKFYILVREIIEIVVSPSFMPGVPAYLEILIAEHHELYMRYFGGLKPKHHFMIHYPWLMERNGPLILLSAFLSERNHRKGKMYAKSCMSRINFPLSVAIKYQLYYCERLMRKEPVLKQRLLMTEVSHCPLNSLRHSASFGHLLQIDMNVLVNSPKSITLYGTLYSIGMVLVTDVGDFLPTFGKIVHIILSERDITFILNLMTTICYDNHICAYEVEQSQTWMCLLHSDCVDHTPLWPRYSIDDGKIVVSLRHSL